MKKRLIALLMVLPLLLSVACAWGDNISDTYNSALQKMAQHDYTGAIEDFDSVGDYEDASRLTMYCRARVAADNGQYDLAVIGMQALGDFRDAQQITLYYTALNYESNLQYEKAAEILASLALFMDSSDRIASYPEKINARDYAIADDNEQKGNLETALSQFKALGSYSDSASRADAVQEKIYERDYAAAEKLENANKLDEALTAFQALGNYKDSADRAAAVKEKINERDYTAADKAEQDGDYAAALEGFTALGNYKDSATRAAAVKEKGMYAQALSAADEGDFAKAYELFTALGSYEDSEQKAYITSVSEFATVKNCGDGIAAFCFHDAWGLINVHENTIISPMWDEIGYVNEYGLAQVSLDGKYGYIDTNGYVVVECKWDAVSEYADGLVTVATLDTDYYCFLYGLCDTQGNIVTDAQWYSLGKNLYGEYDIYAPAFYENRIIVQNEDGLWGFIDAEGNTIGTVSWKSIANFSEGLALVCDTKGKYGFIDKSGNVVIEPQYADALSFSEGLAAVNTKGKWQFIDAANNVVIEPLYTQVYSFSNGTADVYRDGIGWQIIDQNGNLVYFVDTHLEADYVAAKADMDAGNYAEAIAVFEEMTSYKDSESLCKECYYLYGQELLAASDYDGATQAFTDAGDYSDASTQITECQYQKANALNAAGSYDEAYSIFDTIRGYKDVDNIIETDENIAAAAAAEYLAQFTVGNTVTFGNYEGEPIEWLVLDAEGDTRTLISVKGLDAKPYNTENDSVTWETCTLRGWLNGEFLNEAFTADQQAMLETVTVTADENPDYKTDQGNDTQDKVWLLSITEAEKYFSADEDRICYPTQTTLDHGVWTNDSGACWWWLRSSGNYGYSAACVYADGGLNSCGRIVYIHDYSVRPVVVLRLF